MNTLIKIAFLKSQLSKLQCLTHGHCIEITFQLLPVINWRMEITRFRLTTGNFQRKKIPSASRSNQRLPNDEVDEL